MTERRKRTAVKKEEVLCVLHGESSMGWKLSCAARDAFFLSVVTHTSATLDTLLFFSLFFSFYYCRASGGGRQRSLPLLFIGWTFHLFPRYRK